ncbi:hypothetical protein HPB48_008152 [Haemaphysalis longicornis]|uniref:Acyltransferase 3 domain-containing protein n=1 Tax=Haemaphysalis longicornis TaxID=44386 RepID=A0A9J6FFQ5_HAELO|nr:hypothetical protein HPB48_008152 [Haemaphysalis longicornis]
MVAAHEPWRLLTGRIFNMFDFVKHTPFMFIANAYPAADTFFCLSGFLFGYSVFKQRRNLSKWLPILLIRRYVRVIVPCFCLLLVFSLLGLVSSGPIWRDNYALLRGNCEARWWKIPALVNNWEYSLDSGARWAMTCFRRRAAGAKRRDGVSSATADCEHDMRPRRSAPAAQRERVLRKQASQKPRALRHRPPSVGHAPPALDRGNDRSSRQSEGNGRSAFPHFTAGLWKPALRRKRVHFTSFNRCHSTVMGNTSRQVCVLTVQQRRAPRKKKRKGSLLSPSLLAQRKRVGRALSPARRCFGGVDVRCASTAAAASPKGDMADGFSKLPSRCGNPSFRRLTLYDIRDLVRAQCLPHLWFYAADLQLLVGFTPAVVLLVRSPKAGVALTLAMVVACTVYIALQTLYRDLYPVTIYFAEDVMYVAQRNVPG